MLTDLLKVFDCLSHEPLIAKLHVYRFDKRSLVFIHNYLFNRKKSVKINDSYSSWSEILFGVSQRIHSMAFIRDTFYSMEDFKIANYAGELTPFSAKLHHKSFVEELKISSSV